MFIVNMEYVSFREIIKIYADDRKKITQRLFQMDMNLLFKRNHRSKVKPWILKWMLSLILKRGLRNTNQWAFIDLRFPYIRYVVMHFTVVQECILGNI